MGTRPLLRAERTLRLLLHIKLRQTFKSNQIKYIAIFFFQKYSFQKFSFSNLPSEQICSHTQFNTQHRPTYRLMEPLTDWHTIPTTLSAKPLTSYRNHNTYTIPWLGSPPGANGVRHHCWNIFYRVLISSGSTCATWNAAPKEQGVSTKMYRVCKAKISQV